MKKKYHDLFKNTALIALGNFSSKILIFLLIPLYTRCLSTAEYGLYDLTYTTVQLLFPILTLGVTESIMYFLLKGKMEAKNVFSINITFIIIASIIFNIFLLVNNIFHFFDLISNYIIYVSIFFTLYCLNNCFVQFSKGINKVKEMTIAGVLGTISVIAFNILFLVVLKKGLEGYFIANVLGLLAPVLYLAISLKIYNYITLKNSSADIKRVILFSLPLIINTLSWWCNNTADRYIITYFHGVDANGLLSVAYKIPSILTAISAIFIQAWQISAIKEHDKNSKEFYTNLFFVFNGVLCLISGFLIIAVKPIAIIMFANDFFVAWKLVPYLLISSLFNQNAGFIGAILIAGDNSKGISISAAVGIFSNIVLNILFTYLYGQIGITIATLISSFIIFAMREKNSSGVVRSNKLYLVALSWVLLIVIATLQIFTNMYIFEILLYICLVILYNGIYRYCFNILKKRLNRND